MMFGRRFGVRIHPEFEVLAVVFVDAFLSPGEEHGYYVRYRWDAEDP